MQEIENIHREIDSVNKKIVENINLYNSYKNNLETKIAIIVSELCIENKCKHASLESEDKGCGYKHDGVCRNCCSTLSESVCHHNGLCDDDPTKAKNYLCWLTTRCNCDRCDNL